MTEKIIVAGFGGQGVLFAGKLLATAAMENDKYVTWLPAYGPEMRGGTANCLVIIAEKKIGSPIIESPTVLISLNRPSLNKFAGKVSPGGLIVCNETDQDVVMRTDVEVLSLPFIQLGKQLSATNLDNMFTLGALLAHRPFLPLASILNVMQHSNSKNLQDIKNIEAVELGYRLFASPSLASTNQFLSSNEK